MIKVSLDEIEQLKKKSLEMASRVCCGNKMDRFNNKI